MLKCFCENSNNVIKSFIENNISKNEWYVEPFAGDCSILSSINHPKKIASDSNKEIIGMWRSIQGCKINCLNQKKFKENCLKKINEIIYSDTSFNKVMFGVGISQLINFNSLENTIFINQNYNNLIFTNKSFIYCNIFHDNTNIFWDWCRNVVNMNHKLVVSSFDAPKDFICIYDNGNEGIYIHEKQIPFFKI